MKVSDILRVKGGTLYTVSPDERLEVAVQTMAQYDIGSLAVMEHGELVGMLTFRELIGSYNAAMTAVEVSALIEDRAKVEIEATAVIPD